MYKDFKIKPPFFEMGSKAFLYGEEMHLICNGGCSASGKNTKLRY